MIQHAQAGVAVYHIDSDCVEYIRKDGAVYYERVDEFLTLIRDMDTEKTIGFKLKGFKMMFKDVIESLQLTDAQFLYLMKAMESVYTKLAGEITEECRSCYDEAFSIASNDNVNLATGQLRDLAA